MAPSGGGCHVLLAALLSAGTVGATRHIERGAVAAAHAGLLRTAEESSPYSLKSDSNFFRHDYPNNLSPTGPLEQDFDHPYPVVEESDVYDKDFVKDENSDSGEWKAQTEYDRLRTRMERLRVQEHRILKKKEKLERKLEARRAEKELLRKTRGHSDEMRNNTVQGAENDMRDAKDSHKKMRADGALEVGNSSTAVGVTGATKEVEKELEDIEECKKQLAEAQAKLQSLQEEQRKLRGEEGDARAATRAAEKAQAASEKEESELEAEIKRAGSEHESALSAYERKRDEMLDLENRLEKVQMTMLKFRGSHVDQDGGVYKVETESRAKNGALAHATSLSLLVAVPTMVRAVL